MSPVTDTPSKTNQNSEEVKDYNAILEQIRAEIQKYFPVEMNYHKPKFEHSPSRNRMRIYLERIRGSHYEICFRQTYNEFALHFESTPERSLARRQAFDPYLPELTKQVGVLVRSGPLENRGWMRVWFEQNREPIDSQKVEFYTEVYARFIIATFPILLKVYEKGF